MKINPTPEQKELRTLHDLYNKHDPQPVCSVMVKQGDKKFYTQICVCACGGCIAGTGSLHVDSGEQPKIMPHLVDKGINDGWYDPVIRAIAHNELLRMAWLRLRYRKLDGGGGVVRMNGNIRRTEKKYGIFRKGK